MLPKYCNDIVSSRYSKFFSVLMGLIYFLQVSIENPNLYRSILLENYQLCSVARIVDSPKIPMDANNIGLSQSSDSSFSLTTVFFSSPRFIGELQHVPGCSFEKLFFSVPWLGFLIVRRFQKMLTSIYIVLPTQFSHYLHF